MAKLMFLMNACILISEDLSESLVKYVYCDLELTIKYDNTIILTITPHSGTTFLEVTN